MIKLLFKAFKTGRVICWLWGHNFESTYSRPSRHYVCRRCGQYKIFPTWMAVPRSLGGPGRN